jgi:hypothetical protein
MPGCMLLLLQLRLVAAIGTTLDQVGRSRTAIT